MELVNPEIILGSDAGLYAHVNGVRVKVGDIDTNALDINLLDGTVTIKQLHVNLGGGMLDNVLAPVLGALGIPANTPILQPRPVLPGPLGGKKLLIATVVCSASGSERMRNSSSLGSRRAVRSLDPLNASMCASLSQSDTA